MTNPPAESSLNYESQQQALESIEVEETSRSGSGSASNDSPPSKRKSKNQGGSGRGRRRRTRRGAGRDDDGSDASGDDSNDASSGPSPPTYMRRATRGLATCVTCTARFRPHPLTRNTGGGKLCDTCSLEETQGRPGHGTADEGPALSSRGDEGIMDPEAQEGSSQSLTSSTTSSRHRSRRSHRRQGERDLAALGWAEEKGSVPSLQGLCLRRIVKSMDDVQDLGPLPSHLIDRLTQALCRDRLLTPSTSRLFLGGGLTRLHLYDCTLLGPSDLALIPRLSPDLRQLHLGFAGQMSDDALEPFAKLPLTHLHIHGSFLVRDQAWAHLIQQVSPTLEVLSLEHASKLGPASAKALSTPHPITSSPLREIRLRRCEGMTDGMLQVLGDLPYLRVLDLSGSGGHSLGETSSRKGSSITTEAICRLLEARGSGLRILSLSDCPSVTDEVISTIRQCCVRLWELDLSGCDQVTDQAIEGLFLGERTVPPGDEESAEDEVNEGEEEGNGRSPTDHESWVNPWTAPPLQALYLSRLPLLKDLGTIAAVKHSGSTLHTLHLNRCYGITAKGLSAIAEHCSLLEDMDLSWIRAMNDALVDAILISSPSWSQDPKSVDRILRLWGCSRVTECAGKNQIVRMVGRECDTL